MLRVQARTDTGTLAGEPFAAASSKASKASKSSSSSYVDVDVERGRVRSARGFRGTKKQTDTSAGGEGGNDEIQTGRTAFSASASASSELQLSSLPQDVNVVEIVFDKAAGILKSLHLTELFILDAELELRLEPPFGLHPHYSDVREIRLSQASSKNSNDSNDSNDGDYPNNGESPSRLLISSYNISVIHSLFECLHSIDVFRARCLFSEWLSNESLSQYFIDRLDGRFSIARKGSSYRGPFGLTIISSENESSDGSLKSRGDAQGGGIVPISMDISIGDFLVLQCSHSNYWEIKHIDEEGNGRLVLSPFDDSFRALSNSMKNSDDDLSYSNNCDDCNYGDNDDDSLDVVIESSQLVGAYILPRGSVSKLQKGKNKNKRPVVVVDEASHRNKKEYDDYNNDDSDEDDVDHEDSDDDDRMDVGEWAIEKGAKAILLPPLASIDIAFDRIFDVLRYYKSLMKMKIERARIFSSIVTKKQLMRTKKLHDCAKFANTLNWVQRKSDIRRTINIFKSWRESVITTATARGCGLGFGLALRAVAEDIKRFCGTADVLNPLCYILRAICRGNDCNEFKIAEEVSSPPSYSDKSSSSTRISLDSESNPLLSTIYDLVDKGLLQRAWRGVRPATNCDDDAVRQLRDIVKERRGGRGCTGDANRTSPFDSSAESEEWEQTIDRALKYSCLVFFEPQRSLSKYYRYFDDEVDEDDGRPAGRGGGGKEYNTWGAYQDRVIKVPAVIYKCERKRSSGGAFVSAFAANSSHSSGEEGGNCSPLPFLGAEWASTAYGGSPVVAHIQVGDILYIKNLQALGLLDNKNSGGDHEKKKTGGDFTLLPPKHWFYVCRIDFIRMFVVIYPIEEPTFEAASTSRQHVNQLYSISICDLWSIPVYRLFISYEGETNNQQMCDDTDDDGRLPGSVEYCGGDEYDKLFGTASTGEFELLAIDFKTGFCTIDVDKLNKRLKGFKKKVTVNCLVFLTPILNIDLSLSYLTRLLNYVSRSVLPSSSRLIDPMVARVASDSVPKIAKEKSSNSNCKAKGKQSSTNEIERKASFRPAGKSAYGASPNHAKDMTHTPLVQVSPKKEKIVEINQVVFDERLGRKNPSMINFECINISIIDISADSFGLVCSQAEIGGGREGRGGEVTNPESSSSAIRPSLRHGMDCYRITVRNLAVAAGDGDCNGAIITTSDVNSRESKDFIKKRGANVSSSHGSSRHTPGDSKPPLSETVVYEGKSLVGRSFLVNKLQPNTSYTVLVSYFKQVPASASNRQQDTSSRLNLKNHLIHRQIFSVGTLSNAHICKTQVVKFDKLSDSRMLLWVSHSIVDAKTKLKPIDSDPSAALDRDFTIYRIIESRVILRRKVLKGRSDIGGGGGGGHGVGSVDLAALSDWRFVSCATSNDASLVVDLGGGSVASVIEKESRDSCSRSSDSRSDSRSILCTDSRGCIRCDGEEYFRVLQLRSSFKLAESQSQSIWSITEVALLSHL